MAEERTSTILVVEDDPDIRSSFVQFFEPDYDVVTAENGQIALDKVRQMLTKPCIVFLDLMMPVMNGWDFLKAVEHEGLLPGVEIVLITAAQASKVPKNITFLPKPFSLYSIEDFCKASCTIKVRPDATDGTPK